MMSTTSLSGDKEHEKVYTIDEFVEYMSSSNLSMIPSNSGECFVFVSPESDDPASTLPNQTSISSCNSTLAQEAIIRERIKHGLQSISWYNWETMLIQFWQPKISNGRSFLTTSCQPFTMMHLHKGLSWYRKHCVNHNVLVDEYGAVKEDELGPLGRVFLNGQPESSPDIQYYSIKEYPLRDHALRCGLRRYMAFPVFVFESSLCVGVLELVSFNITNMVQLPYIPLGNLPTLCQDINCVFKVDLFAHYEDDLLI